MKQPQRVGLPARLLPVMIRLTALGYLFFFVPDLVLAATHRIQTLPSWLDHLFNWGDGGDAVAIMFATVCIVWALFLFHSARAPLTHRLFLDFNLTANSTHMGAMLVMALVMPEHREHAAGVIALGLITTVPIAACWLPVRRAPGKASGRRHEGASCQAAALRRRRWILRRVVRGQCAAVGFADPATSAHSISHARCGPRWLLWRGCGGRRFQRPTFALNERCARIFVLNACQLPPRRGARRRCRCRH
jgi:hypothetical protein